MSVDNRVPITNPDHPSEAALPRELVERIICLAQDRSQQAFARTFEMRDNVARYERLAVLWDREARWWRVLLRHVDTRSPYLWAVVQAHTAAQRNSMTYRELAERAALLVGGAA